MTFDVLWDRPEIIALSHEELTANQPPHFPTSVNGLPPANSHNFGIIGRNFAPDCKVFWNGFELPSTRSTDRAIRVTVDAQAIAQIGAARVWVVNPAPNRRSSTPVNIQIVP